MGIIFGQYRELLCRQLSKSKLQYSRTYLVDIFISLQYWDYLHY
jgi:hypothetical protein